MAGLSPDVSRAPEPGVRERLGSWKEIAVYLKRSVATARRWEKTEGLCVHRHQHSKLGSVYAYKSELDDWWNSRRARLESIETVDRGRRWRALWWATAGTILLGLGLGLGLNVGALRDQLLGRSAAGDITSIAVLPLRNLSADREQDYFAEGMTEALITQLGKISTLDVISHQSMLGYRGATKPLPQIARELKVHALLEGTVLRSGDRVRITANLVQAAPERHLWAESFEFDQRDILAVQGRVAREIANQIRIKLTPQEQRRLTISRPVDPEAYEAYLLGRAHFYKTKTRTTVTKAKDYYVKAIEKDPGYAPAYASLAELYAAAGWQLARDPRGGYWDSRPQARQWAEKALKLDDTLAETHAALAWVTQQEWDWEGAEREYRRAIELNPSYSLARIWYAIYLYAMQRFEESAAQAQRAQQLDPVSPMINSWAGSAYFFAGRVEEAMTSFQRALELDPASWYASMVLARAHVTQGIYQQAITELQKAMIFNPTEPQVLGALAHAYGRAGQREEALKLVRELKQLQTEGGIAPTFPFVWAYAGLGDNDQAFAWLEKSYQERRERLVWLNVDPLLEPLRSDPRFQDLVRRVGLPIKSPPQPR